ncbi:MAG: hypothetical protein F6K00_15305 [Leptolyngbya sp. SIOISBB]|nr:hypothetical protein [Leptolyngbya sp. SIOISBB]
MASKQHKKRLFSGMGYRAVQRSNSHRRSQLPKRQQQWLKENRYRNVGWDNVIQLYQKINDLLASSNADEPTLEELFLTADRIGQKYQSTEEISAFNQALSNEVENIAKQIDQQFPDDELEQVDYSQSTGRATRKRHRR